MGFDTFTSKELMNITEYNEIASWPTDNILIDETTKTLDSTPNQSDFLYTITVQSHGSYPDYKVFENPEIQVTGGDTEAEHYQWEYYINELHEVDKFIENLIDTLSKRDEKTIVVMYGDHLPGFSFTDEVLKNGDIYQTQYVVWSNFSLPSEKENLESYQLAAHVQQMLGMSEGYLTKFHQKREDTPDYLKDLKILEYDILYGNCDLYGGENPFQATNLIMGQNDITITSAYNYKDYVCVEGSNLMITVWSILMTSLSDRDYQQPSAAGGKSTGYSRKYRVGSSAGR